MNSWNPFSVILGRMLRQGEQFNKPVRRPERVHINPPARIPRAERLRRRRRRRIAKATQLSMRRTPRGRKARLRRKIT